MQEWQNKINKWFQKLNNDMIVIPRPFFTIENFKGPLKPTLCSLLCSLAEDDPGLYHAKIQEAYRTLHQQYHNKEQ